MIKSEDIIVYGKSIDELTKDEWKKLRKEDYHKFEKLYYKNRTIECSCGSKIRRHSMWSHIISKKHITFVNNKESNPVCECGERIDSEHKILHYKNPNHQNWLASQ
jgi:hypothetical protein